jgi:hypothetical protein
MYVIKENIKIDYNYINYKYILTIKFITSLVVYYSLIILYLLPYKVLYFVL